MLTHTQAPVRLGKTEPGNTTAAAAAPGNTAAAVLPGQDHVGPAPG